MRLFLLAFAVMIFVAAGCVSEAPEPVPPPSVPVTLASAEVDSTTEQRFRRVMDFARAERLHERPIGEIMQAVGEHFAGTPYVAGLLDEPAEETLVLKLDGFDCVLFVETALAMARGIAVEDYSFETFARHIRDLRYRDGTLDGYCSRLHYFSEWIADNEARGTVRDLTQQMGGIRVEETLRYMGEHRESYPRLATNDSLFQGILDMEARLRDLERYYIPQDRIHEVYDQLKAGDIIATSTNIDGLDVSHTGLVYAAEDGSIGFMHASTSGGIKVSPDLQQYVQNNKIQIGIVVARPVAVLR